jgi:hypothetical protein
MIDREQLLEWIERWYDGYPTDYPLAIDLISSLRDWLNEQTP